MLPTFLKEVRPGHSTLQMDYFITRRSGAGTDYGMYHQSLREIQGRVDGIRHNLLDREDRRKELSEAEASQDDLLAFRKRIEIQELEESMYHRFREFRHFYNQAVQFRQSLGELTAEEREEMDQEFWYKTLRHKIALEMMANGQVSMSTLELIVYIPSEMKTGLLEAIKNPSEVISEVTLVSRDPQQFEGLARSDESSIRDVLEAPTT